MKYDFKAEENAWNDRDAWNDETHTFKHLINNGEGPGWFLLGRRSAQAESRVEIEKLKEENVSLMRDKERLLEERARLEEHLYDDPIEVPTTFKKKFKLPAPLGLRPFSDDVTKVLMAGLNGAQLQYETWSTKCWTNTDFANAVAFALGGKPIRIAPKPAYQWQRPTEKGQECWGRDNISEKWTKHLLYIGVGNWAHYPDEDVGEKFVMLVAINPDDPNTPPAMDFVPEGSEENG